MINKTFRLFISSTFKDFEAERKILNDNVYSALSRYCQNRGYFFRFIDLRWGVSTASQLSQDTLPICLDEVRRCRRLSPKPNFLIMVGERYGWVPVPNVISESEFMILQSAADSSEKELLTKWYLPDDNAIEKAFYLRAYGKKENWVEAESQLRDALQSCAGKAGFSEEKREFFRRSATEHEIVEGLLGNAGVNDNVVALFRDGYPYEGTVDNDVVQIEGLRRRITEKMETGGSSPITLSYGDGYLEEFENCVVRMLKEKISREIDRLEKEEKAEQALFLPKSILENADYLHTCSKLTASVGQYLENGDGSALLLKGASGSGKSTLLAEVAQTEEYDVFCCFFGTEKRAFYLTEALHDICLAVSRKYQLNLKELSAYNISEVFYSAVNSVPKDRRALFIIDGLDSFMDIGKIHENFIPGILPSNVRMIVSSADPMLLQQYETGKKNRDGAAAPHPRGKRDRRNDDAESTRQAAGQSGSAGVSE